MRLRTWYGANAYIEVNDQVFHKAGIGIIIIPHPPAVNWLLRRGLEPDFKKKLSLLHEFGHLQTLPLSLLYTVSLFLIAVLLGKDSAAELVFMIISIHATWEIFAEIYTVFSAGSLYNNYYRSVSVIPRFLFWSITGLLTVAPYIWFVI